MEESLLPESQQLRRPRQTPDTRMVPAVLPSGTISPPDVITSTTPAYLIPATLGSRTKPRVRARCKAHTTAKMYAGTLSKRNGSCGERGDQRPKRKCCCSSINTYGLDSDHLDQRPAKQQRQQHVSNGPTETLRTRLKQLEPLRTRRS
jgi:hypothetical protein